ncbi:hypothetical protein BOX30_08340 [Leptospirillum ferriphilum]|uniref:DUF1571 domain-containing protein n=1 Tax=Leptospirillum ferriphilum TaxID=178606 RepID=A0A1V3SY91_9BACT|nr:hypothetical protein BOX24_00470 [Leptospirillum ferriphilum]OOH78522.1 hypothetical protein BOX30_08340 [Leptospirillum ferriphilum]
MLGKFFLCVSGTKRRFLFLTGSLIVLVCFPTLSWSLTGDRILISSLRQFSFLPSSESYSFPKALAIEQRFSKSVRSLRSYRCILKNFYDSHEKMPDEWLEMDVVYPQKKVRVNLYRPRKGAKLIYRSDTHFVRVKPFDFLGLVLTLSPKNSLLVSRYGHTIDHADFSSFDHRILRPACLARSCAYLGKGIWKGTSVDVLNVAPDVVEAHRIFGRMVLFFDRKSGWPLLMETLSPDGRFMEKVEYENCRKNVGFPPGFFRM